MNGREERRERERGGKSELASKREAEKASVKKAERRKKKCIKNSCFEKRLSSAILYRHERLSLLPHPR
jgi:hypothetical protein